MLLYNNSSRAMEIQNHSADTKRLIKSIICLICLLLFFSSFFSYGQERKPPIIIVNDEIITMEKQNEYSKQGYIKAITIGVSDEERAKLREKYGDKIGDNDVILQLILYSEEEIWKRNNISDTASFLLKVNDPIKDFTTQMINGEIIKLGDLKGQVVLLNFWATWCAPCIREFHAFPSKIIEPFKNSAFVLLPVSIGETMEKVKEKMEQLKKDGIDFNVGIDPDKSIFDLYAKQGIPKSLVIDKNGIIRMLSTGYSEEKMNEL